MDDFGWDIVLVGAEGLLFLILLGSMLYAGVIYTKRRGGTWPRILAWGTLGNLLIVAAMLSAEMLSFLSMHSSASSVLKFVPFTSETWFLLGGIGTVLLSGLTLLAGVALMFIAWQEGASKKRKPRAKRKKA